MAKPRIDPAAIQVDLYLRNSNFRLQFEDLVTHIKRGITLGMLDTELTKLGEYRILWSNDDPDNPGVYDRHINPATSTPVTTVEVQDFIKEFRTFMQPILNRISGSPKITAADRQVLHIAAPVTTHTIDLTQIPEFCFANPKALGAGDVSFKCKVDTSSSRAHKPEGADAIELAMRMDPPILQKAPDGGDDSETVVVKPTMQSPNDATIREIITKCSFKKSYGVEKEGWVLNGFARWINTKHPEKNGKWTGPFRITLS